MKFRGLRLLAAVGAVYVLFYLFNADKTIPALQKSGAVLVKILPVLLLVILFTALINFFLKPKEIASHLGEESGVKGWAIALIAGIISHGPMYAWYPMPEDLKQHGLKNGLIGAFFYSRAVKIPLLPIMIDYFGFAFTAILTVYILFASVIQGLLIDRLCRKYND